MQAQGSTIRRQREESGYGLTAFARHIGISPGWLSRIERGKAKPSPDVLRRIAVALSEEQAARAAITQIARHEAEAPDVR
ncbi:MULTISPECIES: helix-turn-helix domain-containing protein [Streptomyces]|uniref:Helix-turn-helix transcriptional regulator n=2 Tax=Streptomyces rimosus subsp. rimosus TaxID=132474 RepID=A0A8A1UL64_STRR1|nr:MULTISPECIES: helix-turn-helix transcriptional regulator [Streptomyces]MYT44876.1 helix-turn-helix domain-containing protein [Streptomyces sp. SID5471]QDA07245.1 XRE family transcriptional regulator [Streptomyces rimosus]QEV78526.1 XRE family transcriptional regulator [Streptomyces rimosus]QGY70362.1 helix-turn-helix domain-containing protein [Streptomyces rimosus R6-500]QST80728.1 helix-turn-helix transcriptional regulator [Streptomyces rimosus subsp. rimosus ATCC 10970]